MGLLALTSCAGSDSAEGAGDYPTDPVAIMAPADPGGGYDMTARNISQTLTEESVIETSTEVYNVSGGSGTVGLSQFIGDNAGNPHELMVIGAILVGAIEQTDSQVSLADTTPIARLTAEYDAIVVPADSEYETFEQLMEDFAEDPGSIAWGGGSVGGVDQILVGQLAQAVDAEPDQINYVPYAGGGELTPALLSGDVTAAASGTAEFTDLVDAGDVRVLAVSSEEPIDGIDAPTIMETGYDASIANWRGIVAPPEITDEQRDAVVDMIDQMAETDQWQETLEANNWDDFRMLGEDYTDYIADETESTIQTLQDLGITE